MKIAICDDERIFTDIFREKLEKGKTISEIADDLEDTEENIVHLIKEFHLGRKES